MTELTQQQVEELIQSINDAEEPESISNEMVAEILSYLNEKYKAGDISLAQVEATISAIQIAISSLQTGLSGVSGNFESIDDRKTDKNIQTGRLAYPQAPVVVLASMGQELDSVGKSNPVAHMASEGDYIWDANNGIQYYKSIDDVKQIGPPQRGIVYTNAHSNRQYRWNGTTWLQVGGNDIEIVNGFNSASATKALSAKAGKVIKNNIEALNANFSVLLEALAGIAFKDEPPELATLDFSGDKALVTIENTLTGCNADKVGAQQVTVGGDLVVNIYASEGKLLRSVTASQGNVDIAQDQASATITISNIQDDLTVAVTATATDKHSYNVTMRGQYSGDVNGTGATSNVIEGSSWTTVLSVNENAEEGTVIIPPILVEMNGETAANAVVTDNANGTYTVHIPFVTGNIVIEVEARVVGVWDVQVAMARGVVVDGVTFDSDADTATSSVSRIIDGENLSCVISPINGYRITQVPTVTVDGVEQQNAVTANLNSNEEPDGTYTVAIQNVTSDVVITVATVEIWKEEHKVIGWRRGIKQQSGSEANGSGFITSPRFILNQDSGNWSTARVKFARAMPNGVEIWFHPSLTSEVAQVNRTNLNGKTGPESFNSQNRRYVSLTFYEEVIDQCYIFDTKKGGYVWKGKDAE